MLPELVNYGSNALEWKIEPVIVPTFSGNHVNNAPIMGYIILHVNLAGYDLLTHKQICIYGGFKTLTEIYNFGTTHGINNIPYVTMP